MNVQASSSHEARSSVMGLAVSCALLGVLLAPVAVVVAAICTRGFSTQALFVAAVAGSVCWLAAGLALAATWMGHRIQSPVPGMLLGMFFRMGLPLAAVIGLPQLGGAFATAGLTMTILGVYLVALLIETILAVRMISPLSGAKAMSGASAKAD